MELVKLHVAVQIWRPSLFVLVSNVSDVFGASVLKSSLSHFVSGFSAEVLVSRTPLPNLP